MNEKSKNILIGLFLVAAIATSIYLILFLEPKIGDGKKVFHVRFSNIAGISVGTRVMMAGSAVGEVEKITVSKGPRGECHDKLGRLYYYTLILRVDSSVQIFNNDEITIQTTGLLGEKSIGIIPKAPRKGKKPKEITSQVVFGNSIDPLENALFEFSTLSNKIEKAVVDIDDWFVENEKYFNCAIKSFSETMQKTKIAVETFNRERIICTVKAAVNSFRDSMDIIHSSLQEIQDKDMIAKFNTILDNFVVTSKSLSTDGRDILNNINMITQNIAEGKGTVGKLVKSEDIYIRLTSLLSKADALMNDINHYGILFQYDKGWQRSRTKKANLLEALNTPSEFKHYFEGEVDNITLSLGRISQLLEKAEGPNERIKVMNSTCFKKGFVEMLNQVEDLLDSVKLYNQKLSETINEKCDLPSTTVQN